MAGAGIDAVHVVDAPGSKELTGQLEARVFWQVHRSTLVRASAIARVTRDDAGRLHLALHGRPEQLAVSRLYAHQFKAM